MIPKFRAWLKNDKEMIDVDEIHWYIDRLDFIGDGITFMRKADEIELMQSTGLFDKNGKEIFEGDILELKDCGETIGNVKVYWDGSLALFQLDAIIVDEKAPIYKVVDDEDYSYRVIGNIYENQYILEADNDQ